MIFRRAFAFLLLVSLFLAGCALGGAPAATGTPRPTETAIPTETLTPTPQVPLAILLMPEDLPKEDADAYETLVYTLAQQDGMRFQVRNHLSVEDLAYEPALKVLIALPPAENLAELAAAAPQAQFLAVNVPGITAGGNISVLANSSRPDVVAFLAGYIAAMITEDYHIGIMLSQDDPYLQNMQAAYANGMTYYCGLCNPWAGPFYDYPLHVEIPGDADPKEYNAYADYLTNHQVETMYVSTDLATADFLTYLSSSGTLVIGSASPARKLGNWVVTIQPDIPQAIQTAWADLVAGNGGISVPSPLSLTDVQPDFLTPGKQRLAQQVLDDLQAGLIDTGAAP